MPAPERSSSPSAVPDVTLTKHHGLGNDFLVALDPPRPLDGGDAQRWCHRREGIGADGLIQALPVETDPADAGQGPHRRPTRWRMTLWNSDGGRAAISGNGLRCLAQALADRLEHDRTTALELTVETDAGDRQAVVQARSSDSAEPTDTDQVRVSMGTAVEGPAPSSRWSEAGVEVSDQLGVDIGNPHLVGFVSDLDALDMAVIGPIIEADHPDGLNVHLVRVIDRGSLEMVIWERGAGVTMACGSGACAAAWTAHRAGLVDAEVVVDMPGGSAQVEVGADEVILTGPAVRVGEVRLDG